MFQADQRGKHLSDVFQYPMLKRHANGQARKTDRMDENAYCKLFFRVPVGLLDPFCGSGATIDACRQLGKSAIGIEIDPALCAGNRPAAGARFWSSNARDVTRLAAAATVMRSFAKRAGANG